MTLRRLLIALALSATVPAAASAANYETANFVVEAPTPELARQFGDMAEFYREEKALEWLGRKMPAWPRKCPLQVQITAGSAGGATTFTFGSDATGRAAVTSQRMEIRGEKKQLLNSVLPHEVTHTVLAHHFGRAVPRWADEGGSVLSENDEERFSHDVRCRELLNAGRGIRLRVLFRMAEYPRDMIVLYAQGYSVVAYLVEKGGGGRDGRSKLLQFLAGGMAGNDPRAHGTAESWNESARRVYGYETIDALEEAWLQALRTPPSRTAARDNGSGAGSKGTPAASFTSAAANGTRTELRSSAPPALPLLEPPVRARAAAPDFEPSRPTHLPPAGAKPARSAPDLPPPVLGPPELPRPVRP